MEEEPTPIFKTPQEEIDFYKNLFLLYKKKSIEIKEDLDEFQDSSKELELELEAQLSQAESRLQEYVKINNRLQLERERLQETHDKIKKESFQQISDLQEELVKVKSLNDKLHTYVRELEQNNDDLERAKRATVSSLEDFESRLNLAIERNAFLESELDEKEALAVHVQRLKDEVRDLRQELMIQQSNKSSSFFASTHPPDNDIKAAVKGEMDSNKLNSSQVQLGSPFKAPISNTSPINNSVPSTTPLTPSSRISALNIVSDLLRKVGALESKLASCRTYSKENPPRIGEKESGLNSPLKLKRLK